jgi:hypothetical protein
MMKKYFAIISILFICDCSLHAQIVGLKELKINDRIVSLDLPVIKKVDSVLSDLMIPYEAVGIKGSIYYKIEFHPTVTVTVLRGIDEYFTSGCLKKLKSQEFLKLLPVNYDTVNDAIVTLKIEYDEIPPGMITEVPLETYGSLVNDINISYIQVILSNQFDKKKYRSIKGHKGVKHEKELIMKNRQLFCGNQCNLVPISKDSTLIFSETMGGCLEPLIAAVHLLVGDTIISVAKFQLYDETFLFNEKNLKIAVIQNKDKRYIKSDDQAVNYFISIICLDDFGSINYKKVIDIKPVGNCLGFIKTDAFIYVLSNYYNSRDVYGIVEVKTENNCKIFIGGWIE